MTEINRQLDGGRSPLAEMLTVALPTVVTMSSFTVMQFVDSLMVSRIGPEPHYVAAQGNGGMANWVALSFFFGLTSVINTYVSQNVGAGKPERAARYGWTGAWLALGWWPLMLVAAAFMPAVFGALGHEGELLRAEIAYAQILLVGSVFKLVNKGFSEFFFGVHRPIVVTISVVAGNIANIIANYVLIFGVEGVVPAMGVVGAAYGTLIGYVVEFAVQQSVFFGRTYHAEFKTRTAWRPSWSDMKDTMRLGWPSGAQFANETACWWILTALLLGLGGAAGAVAAGVTDEAAIAEAAEVNNAAGWIALRYMHAAFMPAVGLSIAVTAIVGRCMGAGRPDLAAKRAWLGVKLAMVYMGACAIAMVVFREPMMRVFIDSEATPEQTAMLLKVGGGVMIAAALFQLGDALGIILIGALRGAGDTTWPGLVNVILSWVFIVGGGFVMVELLPQLGSIGPWIAAAVFITALGLAMMARFLGGKWKSIKLVEQGPADGSGRGPDPHLHQTLPGEPLSAPPDAVSGATPGQQ
ncbi:MAG: MATE family efflux transporter [Planctomycetota bacterium]